MTRDEHGLCPLAWGMGRFRWLRRCLGYLLRRVPCTDTASLAAAADSQPSLIRRGIAVWPCRRLLGEKAYRFYGNFTARGGNASDGNRWVSAEPASIVQRSCCRIPPFPFDSRPR